MKSPSEMNEAEMRARFDFSKVTRGRFADRYRIGHTVTLLDHDPDEERMRENEEQAQNTRKSGMRIFESQVREAGLRLGEPARQSGIDYFIYSKTQTGEESLPFPVKLKTSVHEVFSLYKKESRIPRLLMAYVWHAKNPDESEIYALTYKEALEVVKRKPYASTKSWVEDGGYSVTHAGAELKAMLTQYRMNPKNGVIGCNRSKNNMAAKRKSKGAYMISAVAEMYEIHPQTLRLYEREGLLKPSRTDGNTRLYTDEDLERLEFILNLARDLGVNIAGIGIILQMRERMEEMNRQMQSFVEYVRSEMLTRFQQAAPGPPGAIVPIRRPTVVARTNPRKS